MIIMELKDKVKTYVVNYVAVIILAIVATAAYIILTEIVKMDSGIVLTLLTLVMPFVYKVLPDGSAAVFDSVFNYLKAGWKKTDASVDLGAYVGVLAWLGTFIVAAIAFIKSFFAKKPKYPAFKGVKYTTDKGGDLAVIDLDSFDRRKQLVVAQIPDGASLMPIQGANGGWFAPWQIVIYGAWVEAGTIITIKDLWTSTPLTDAQKYILIIEAANPVAKVIELYGDAAKKQIAPSLDGTLYEMSVQNAITKGDLKTAVDVFCKLTGWTVPGPK